MRGIRLLPATFLLTPLREGRHEPLAEGIVRVNFYSRPCGRGDELKHTLDLFVIEFLLTPLREGRRSQLPRVGQQARFLLTPLREGRRASVTLAVLDFRFLLTPLREGRPDTAAFYHRTAAFLLTPLREGRRRGPSCRQSWAGYFYSRPCGRGD